MGGRAMALELPPTFRTLGWVMSCVWVLGLETERSKGGKHSDARAAWRRAAAAD